MHKRCAIVVALLVVMTCGNGAGADVVTDWNTQFLTLMRDQTSPISNLPAGRALAMMHTAMFDAINAVNHNYNAYRVNMNAPAGTSAEAAGAAAAYRVLSTLYPSKVAALDTLYNTQLAAIPDATAKANGIAVGQQVADSIYNWRTMDGSMAPSTYQPTNAPGHWQPTPPNNAPAMNPQWAAVTPWVMTAPTQFRKSGPPALSSAEYAAAYSQVKQIGAANSSTRTAEQTAIGKFWADTPGKNSPLWHWNEIAQQVGTAKGYNLEQNARLFGLLTTSMADGMIAAWDMKYHYDWWRPVTAIRAGDSDTNDDTVGDAAWMPLVMTPAFPEYVSTHSLVFAAAARTLANVTGNDAFDFVRSSEFDGTLTPRQFHSFWSAAEEAGISRIYAGLHFQYSNLDGLASGQQIADYVYGNAFAPVPEPVTIILLAAGMVATSCRRRC